MTSWMARLRAHDPVVVELLVALAEQVAVLRAQALVLERAAARRPAARPPRTASAGSRTPPASWPRSRSPPWRGRSSSGSAAARPRAWSPPASRISSRPVRSGIRLSTTSRSKGRSPSSRCASRGAGGGHAPRGPRRAARGPSVLRIFSSSSTSRTEPCGHRVIGLRGGRGAGGRGRAARCAPRCPRRGRLSTVMVPPSASTMFLAMARPRPVPVRLVVK